MSLPGTSRALPLMLVREGRGLQEAIHEALRSAMLEGRLGPGSRLPSSRDLAHQLRVARGTVVLAYEQLSAEGYLRGARGAGTYVVESLPDRWFSPGQAPAGSARRERRVTLSTRGERLARSPFHPPFPPTVRPFRPHMPAVSAFPHALWARLVGRHARRSRTESLSDGDSHGHRALREAIAEHLRQARGVRCTGDRVVIASGTQQLLDIAARLLLDEGDAVWMEDPGHFGAREVLRAAGARLVPIPVDGAGVDVGAGIRAAGRARLAFLTPARQAPMGASLSLERRLELLAWANRSGAWIFEDDYDSEFVYEGGPLPALQGLDAHGVVIHSGTFSKSVFPGIRIGYAVVPEGLVEPFTAALSLLSRYVPVVPQLAMADFIAEGHFGRHLRRMRMLYAARRQSLLEALNRELPAGVDVIGSKAGLDLVLQLPAGISDRTVARAAWAAGLEPLPLSKYTLKRLRRGGLVVGFAAVGTPRTVRAVPQLVAAMNASSIDSRPRPTARSSAAL